MVYFPHNPQINLLTNKPAVLHIIPSSLLLGLDRLADHPSIANSENIQSVRALNAAKKGVTSLCRGVLGESPKIKYDTFEDVVGKKEHYYRSIVQTENDVIEIFIYLDEAGYLFNGKDWHIF